MAQLPVNNADEVTVFKHIRVLETKSQVFADHRSYIVLDDKLWRDLLALALVLPLQFTPASVSFSHRFQDNESGVLVWGVHQVEAIGDDGLEAGFSAMFSDNAELFV
jgi:hypothetical protein